MAVEVGIAKNSISAPFMRRVSTSKRDVDELFGLGEDELNLLQTSVMDRLRRLRVEHDEILDKLTKSRQVKREVVK